MRQRYTSTRNRFNVSRVWCFGWSCVPNRTCKLLVGGNLGKFGKVEFAFGRLGFLFVEELVFAIVKNSARIR